MMSSYNYEASCLYIQCRLYLYTGCSNGNVRFRDQPLEMDDSVKGVVQFCGNGEWKTLCASSNWLTTFSSNAAPYVVCRQLGYSERGIIIPSMLTVYVCMHIYRSYKGIQSVHLYQHHLISDMNTLILIAILLVASKAVQGKFLYILL